jgi:hypothetical protein
VSYGGAVYNGKALRPCLRLAATPVWLSRTHKRTRIHQSDYTHPPLQSDCHTHPVWMSHAWLHTPQSDCHTRHCTPQSDCHTRDCTHHSLTARVTAHTPIWLSFARLIQFQSVCYSPSVLTNVTAMFYWYLGWTIVNELLCRPLSACSRLACMALFVRPWHLNVVGTRLSLIVVPDFLPSLTFLPSLVLKHGE